MDRAEATTLLDRLIGLEAAIGSMLAISQQLQASRNDRLKAFASNMHRHARGEQCAIAAIKQELTHSS